MKIGELANRSGSNVETVRYYERIGLLTPPARTGSNYRSYDIADAKRLTFVRRARELGFTLKDVRELLSLADDRTQSCAAVDALALRHRATIEKKLTDLATLATELDRVTKGCELGVVGDCRIVELLAAGSNERVVTP